MDKLTRITTGIGVGLSALLLAGCGGTAEAEPLPAAQASVASVIPSGPSDLETEKVAEAQAAVEAARVAAEAEAARIAAEQAAAEAARIASEEAAREAARVAAAREAAPRSSAPQQSTRPGGSQAASEPGGTAAPRPAPAPAPEPSNPYTKANFAGATLLSCNADNTMMTIRMNFTSGSYTATVPNGVTTGTIPSGERVDVRVECGM